MNPNIDADGNLEVKRPEQSDGPPTYRVGQFFVNGGEYYMLASESNGMGMICINDGVWWCDPVQIDNPSNITLEQLHQILEINNLDGWEYLGNIDALYSRMVDNRARHFTSDGILFD